MRLNVIPSLGLERGQARLQSLQANGARRDAGVEPARLKAAAQEFEAILLELMVKEMRKNVPESPIFGRDTGREIFNEMLDAQYVRLVVQRGGLGLTDLLTRQLGRHE
jgi:Rod binding domain-containing protein